MPLINIPRVGDCLVLEADFTFKLFYVGANTKLITQAKIIPPWARLEWAAGMWAKLTIDKMVEHAAASGWTLTREQHLPDEGWRYFTFRQGTELVIERYTMKTGSAHPTGAVFKSQCWISELGDPLMKVPRKVKQIKFWIPIDDLNRMRAGTCTRHW